MPFGFPFEESKFMGEAERSEKQEEGTWRKENSFLNFC